MSFDGFISYSHAADGRLAPALQRGLHRLGKQWHRRRALWIFRDQTGLSVTPGLWSSIQHALDGSQWFVLLASPEAAQSHWVNREIAHWVATKSVDRILPVVTGGAWTWDPAAGDFTEESSAVPATLRGLFAEEPLYLDLRWARDAQHLDLRHSRFRDAIAQLAAPMHGVSKDDLEGEDVRQHRLVRRLQSAAVTTVVVLGFVALVAGLWAVRNAERASAAAGEALRQQQMAAQQTDNAKRSDQKARQQEANAQKQEKLARDALAAARQLVWSPRDADTPNDVTAVVPGPHGVLAIRDGDGIVSLWNVVDRADPVRVATVGGAKFRVDALAWSPDGRTLATSTSGTGNTVITWHVTDGFQITRLGTIAATIGSGVTFSPDGRTLAVLDWNSPDAVASLWDVSTPAEPKRL